MKKINILIVEDIIDDAELIIMELEKNGYQPEWERVYSESEMRKKLKDNKWDVIISDYVMPGFSGMDALKIAKEYQTDIPFIIVSGTVGEDMAVEAMRNGAHDYIMKGNLTRLGEALRRELKDAEDRRQHKQTKQKYEASKAQLNSIFKTAPLGIGVVHNRYIKFVNDRLCKMLGYTSSELIGQSSRIFYFTDEEFERVGEVKYGMIKEKGIGYIETIYRKKDGKSIEILLSSSVLNPEDPEEGFTFTVQDISERRKHETLKSVTYNIANAVNTTKDLNELVGKIRELIGQIIDTSNFYIALYDKENDSFQLPFFIDEKDSFENVPAGKTLTKYVIDQKDALLLKDEDIKELEKQNVIKRYASPSKCWMGVPLYVDEEIIGVLGIQSYQDRNAYNHEDLELLSFVSEQVATSIKLKEAQDNLLYNERRYRTLADASNEAIFVSVEGKCIDANKVACSLFGYEYDEFIGIYGTDIAAEESKELIKHNMLSGYEEPYEAVALKKDGTKFSALFQGRMYEYKNRKIRLTTCRDLTAQKNNENELIKAKEKAEESDRLKSAFLANISHEIRTPMNAILGFSQLLLEPDLDQDSFKQFIDLINTNSQVLLRILDDIIDISRIESEEINIRKDRVSLNKLIEDVNKGFEASPEYNVEVELKTSFPANSDNYKFCIDEQRITQVLNNLIGNAIKFTHQGYIECGYDIIHPNNKHDNESLLNIYVKDTGIGIPEDKYQIIFDRFRQVDETHTRVYGGTGLGLTITKSIVELMGGKIWLESELGVGSIFYVTLPLNDSQLNDPVPNTKAGLDVSLKNSERNILIVEDVESNYIYLEALLNKYNHNIMWAKDGFEALDFVKSDHTIDIILMDIQLPKRNGYEITKDIRKINKDVPIIAQTAYARVGDKEKSLESGCNDYITKPIQKSILLEKLNIYLGEKEKNKAD